MLYLLETAWITDNFKLFVTDIWHRDNVSQKFIKRISQKLSVLMVLEFYKMAVIQYSMSHTGCPVWKYA